MNTAPLGTPPTSPRKKIGFFLIATSLGGAEKSLFDFLSIFHDHDEYSSVVITPKKSGPLLESLQGLKLSVVPLPMPALFLHLSRKTRWHTLLMVPAAALLMIPYFCNLLRFLHKHKFDMIHSTGIKNHLILGVAAALTRTPVCLHLRDIVPSRALRWIFRQYGRSAMVSWIANSKATAASLAPCPAPVIYNGFPPAAPAITANFLRTTFHLQPTDILIGVVAVIARWKGQREFLQMAEKLLPTNPNYHFFIVGSPIYDTRGERSELEVLQEQAISSSHPERIHFLPFQKDIGSVYADLDILVHSSIAPEPFGRVIVEAMQHQVAVVAGDAGGPVEILTHEYDGLLYSIGSVDDMTSKVQELGSNSEQRKSLGRNAVQGAQRFSLRIHTESMIQAWQPRSAKGTRSLRP